MSARFSSLPFASSDFTTRWASAIARRHEPDIQVTAVEIMQREVGTTTRTRLKIRYNRDTRLPGQWFVKRPSRHWHANLIMRATGLLSSEVRFYRQLAASVPVPVPQLLSASGNELVLADLRVQQKITCQPGQTLDASQALSVVNALGRLHRRFQQPAAGACLPASLAWLGSRRRLIEERLGSLFALPLMKRGLRLAGSAVPQPLHGPALRYAAQRRRAMQLLNRSAPTLTHHDCHGGNLFFDCNGQPGLLDWQLVRLGDGVGDLAYFIASSLDPESRRLHEPALLQAYQQASGQSGHPSAADFMLRYRAQLCYAFEAMVMTLAIGGMMPRETNLALIARTAAAVDEHQGFTALSELAGREPNAASIRFS